MDLFGQFAHRFARNDPAAPSCERCLGGVNSGKNFVAPALALDTQFQPLAYRVLSTLQPAVIQSTPDEILLFARKFDLHQFSPP